MLKQQIRDLKREYEYEMSKLETKLQGNQYSSTLFQKIDNTVQPPPRAVAGHEEGGERVSQLEEIVKEKDLAISKLQEDLKFFEAN